MTKQTITAFYDSREYANNAALKLKQEGVPDTDIILSPEAGMSGAPEIKATGFWASIEEMLGGTDDRETYAEGLRRGGTLLTAHVDDTLVDEAMSILEQHGSIDLDERETTWRSEGWSSGALPVTGGGAHSDGAGELRGMGTETTTREAVVPVALTSYQPATAATARAGQDDVVQVVEESLDVGKRAVSRGKVRLHTYVVETPVSEAVTLRNETVSIDRRPVDRALGVAEVGLDPFRDRTIEMEETAEEAVVAKSVRVVEEIGIRKDVTDKVHTISDTVRSTKVDVEDDRTTVGRTGLVSGFSAQLTEDMEVVGSDGQHVGVIDHVDGTTIKLKRMDPASGDQHHTIPIDWVASVDSKVILKTTAVDAKSRWTAAG